FFFFSVSVCLSFHHRFFSSFPTRRSSDLRRCSGGIRNGIRVSRFFRLARTSRCASVASGTRNARAISGVVSPPTRLSVNATWARSEEHTSELQSRGHLVCRLLLEKKKIEQ